MYTLYYAPGACSLSVHAILNELGVPFKAENMSFQEGKNKTPEYLKINPLGSVPLLQDGSEYIREGAAIIIHLLEKHKSPLLPSSGIARTKALEWLMFCNATLHPAYGKGFFLMKRADKPTQDKLFPAVRDQIMQLWDIIDAQLAKTPYLAGKEVTAADFLMTVMANWGSTFPNPIKLGNNARRVVKEISARPSFKKALQTEGVEYKAAA